MKLFLLRAAVFFTLSGLVAVALDYAVSGGLRKSNYNEFEGWSDICEGTINADLVLLGSSRAMDHFATPVLYSVLNLNSYNLGYSGGRFSDWKLKFDIYKQRNIKPKYLVISLDLFAFSPKEGVADQVQLYPYIHGRFRVDVFQG